MNIYGNIKLKKKLPSSYKDIVKISNATYESIIAHNTLPAECNIMFSTSVLKEGIDIWNDNRDAPQND